MATFKTESTYWVDRFGPWEEKHEQWFEPNHLTGEPQLMVETRDVRDRPPLGGEPEQITLHQFQQMVATRKRQEAEFLGDTL